MHLILVIIKKNSVKLNPVVLPYMARYKAKMAFNENLKNIRKMFADKKMNLPDKKPTNV